MLDLFPDDVVDCAWTPSGGEVLSTPEGLAAITEYVGSQSESARVSVSRPGVLPYRDRQALERAVLDIYEDAPFEAMGARYDPVAHAVTVTVWTDAPAEVAAFHHDHATTVGGVWADVEIRIEYEPAAQAPVTDSNTRGGYGYSTCTGGFIATRGTAYGITTSAHGIHVRCIQ
ncbi:hypothetical protein [Pseudactinotalea terrae]|uniref:hypothetical protein n=1 Tax=Pseudactinotalea terrae TaxID=1743262 RepID=UPI0012E1EC89|nr:hypothetical protein [Pseudactinotalea terrae]